MDFFVSYSPADERWALWIAWVLESAGYRTMVQAWDFVPSTEFIDFMDRGVRQSAAVIAVLSPSYLRSTYGRMEWQAALRSSPHDPGRRLIPIRIAECELEGLLATITYLDLLGETDERAARHQLLARVRDALSGRAETAGRPAFPAAQESLAEPGTLQTAERPPSATLERNEPAPRRRPIAKPLYPTVARPEVLRDSVSLLHLPGPRFGRGLVGSGEPSEPEEWEARIVTWLARAAAAGSPDPDLLLVSGDLTENGAPRQVDAALRFLTGLRARLGLEPGRIALVPGPHDVSSAACRAYFADCEADDVAPRAPYWPKWRHFSSLFHSVYQGMESLVFDADQPWSLFEVPDLRLVVAGFNSTIALSHRPDDRYGMIGDVQAAYFARMMRSYEQDGWLRVGLVAHPVPATAGQEARSEVLRDADVFTRLLMSVNLVVHGPGLAGSEIGWLSNRLPLVPPPGSGTPQLLELTSSGLTRWTTDRNGLPQQSGHATGWSAAHATFHAPQPASVPGPPAEEAEPADLPAPVQELLDRVAEVCKVRFDRARVRSLAVPAPHLRVTYAEEGYVRTVLVGAITGPDAAAQLDQFVRRVHAAAPADPAEIVHDLTDNDNLAALRTQAAHTGVRLRSLADFQGLPDLGDFLARQTERLSQDTAYPAAQYVRQRFRPLIGTDRPVQDDVVAELTRLALEEDGRFVLLLGDFGRGKTFALRELTRRLAALPSAPLPVLIDLRNLDRAHNVDGLVAAHLANQGNTVIDLRSFRYLMRRGRIILIFDGFDELVSRVSYDRAADHLEMLVQAAQEEAKIVVTSRSQHFRSREHVLTALGERVGLLPQCRVLHLLDFDPGQVLEFLTRAYGDRAVAKQRYRLFEQISDLSELAANPRMLAFLAQLDPERLAVLIRGRHALSAAGLYQEIVDYWLEFESRRTSQIAGAAPGLTPDELLSGVTALAVRLWERGEDLLRPTDLAEVADTLDKLAAPLTGPETEHALGSGSLLTRTDEGLFGFIHGSVGEWLVARHIAGRLGEGDDRQLRYRPLSGLAVDFLCNLAPAELLDAWVRRATDTPPADRDRHSPVDHPVTANALLISSRLRIEITNDLRGADLSGQDLSFRNFQRVNLSGADLTGARLLGSNLTGADLSGANLAGARLADTDLTGANLTGANLTRARLLGTRLDRAELTGSRWDMAALIGMDQPELSALPELRGAAVTPPMPVRLGLAPAEVGVPYGFETGRIPDPVSYHPHGTTLVFGSADGGLLVCDAANGQPVRTVAGHRNRIYAVRHSPDGKLLLTGSADGTARIWDADSFTELQVLAGHSGWVWPVELAPSGRLAATGDASGNLRVWDTATGDCITTLSTRASRIWATAFHPNRLDVATGEADGTVRLRDAVTGNTTYEFRTDSGAAYRVRFSPDGNYLASAHDDGTVYEHWIGECTADAVDPNPTAQRLDGIGRAVYCLRYHPNGRYLATGDTGGTVTLWTLGTDADVSPSRPGERPWARQVWTRHSGAVYGLNFSVDGRFLASSDSDGMVRLGDPVEAVVHQELSGHRSSVWPMAFRVDGAMMATSSNDGTLRVWDTGTGANLSLIRGHGRRLSLARFNYSGTHIATSGNDGIVREWDSRTGRLVSRKEVPGGRLESGFYSPDGSVIAAWDNSGIVHVWNAASGEYERQINTDSDHLWTGKFSPDGDVLATAEDDDSVRLRYRTTGRVIADLIGHRGRVRSIAFSPDERWLATGADDHDVRIWHRKSRQCVAVLHGHKDRVYSVTFDPQTSLVASAANDGAALIWDVAELLKTEHTGSEVPAAVHRRPHRTLKRGTGRLWSVAINPDGTLLATAGDDLAVRLWNVRTGDHLSTLLGHTGRVWSVDFSPTRDALVSSGDDGTAVVWDLSPLAVGRHPAIRMTLIGLTNGWVAATPDGRYKLDGEVGSDVWHVVGNCRFPLDGLGQYLPQVRRVPFDQDLASP